MRVLAATDLSKPSDEALRQAAALAGPDGAFAAVHVMPSMHDVNMLFPQRHVDDALDAPALTLRVAELVRARAASVARREAEVFVEEGTDYAEIVRRAETWRADVVVLGSHGHAGLARAFGGVAQRVVRHAHARVLVVRESPARGVVLAATDLSDSSLPAVVAAGEEARRRGAVLKIVHAVDFLRMESIYLAGLGTPSTYDPTNLLDPVRARLADSMRRIGVTADAQVLDGSPAATIVRHADAIGAELIVVGSHGRTGLTRLLLGSVAEKIVAHASCSVLVVRASA